MIIFEIFELIFIQPLTNILLGIYQLVNAAGIIFPLAVSLILVTILLRVLLYPFMSAQIRSSKKMQELAPEMKDIREKYKKDKQKQQQEMMKLYKKYNINPAAGCLPALIQLPIIIGLYQVIIRIVAIDSFDTFLNEVTPLLYFDFLKPQSLWDTSFFGAQLASQPIEIFQSNPFIILVPLFTAASQLILSKMMMTQIANKDPKKPDDFQTSFMKQSLYIFPLMIGFFSFSLPMALSIYWITFTLFGILQQYLLVGFGGLLQWFPALKQYERHTK